MQETPAAPEGVFRHPRVVEEESMLGEEELGILQNPSGVSRQGHRPPSSGLAKAGHGAGPHPADAQNLATLPTHHGAPSAVLTTSVRSRASHIYGIGGVLSRTY